MVETLSQAGRFSQDPVFQDRTVVDGPNPPTLSHFPRPGASLKSASNQPRVGKERWANPPPRCSTAVEKYYQAEEPGKSPCWRLDGGDAGNRGGAGGVGPAHSSMRKAASPGALLSL